MRRRSGTPITKRNDKSVWNESHPMIAENKKRKLFQMYDYQGVQVGEINAHVNYRYHKKKQLEVVLCISRSGMRILDALSEMEMGRYTYSDMQDIQHNEKSKYIQFSVGEETYRFYSEISDDLFVQIKKFLSRNMRINTGDDQEVPSSTEKIRQNPTQVFGVNHGSRYLTRRKSRSTDRKRRTIYEE